MTETCNTTSTSFKHELTPVAEDASTNLTNDYGSGNRGHRRIESEETTHGTGSGRLKSYRGGEGEGEGIARGKQIMKAAFVEFYSQKNLDLVQQGKQLSGAISKFEEALVATMLEIVDEFLGDLREKFYISKCIETCANIFWVAGIEVLGNQSQRWRVRAAILRGLEEDRIVSGSRNRVEIQQAAKAALLAGAAEVFRVCEVPEGWDKVEGKQVVAAAIEANTFIIDTDHIEAALIGSSGLFRDALMKVNEKFSRSRSRAHNNSEAARRKAHVAALVERVKVIRGHLWSRIPRAAAGVTLQCALG